MQPQHYLTLLLLAIVMTGCASSEDPEPVRHAGIEPATPEAAQTGTEKGRLATDPELTAVAASLPILGPAPAWQNETWINTKTPLPLEALRGKVVLLEFWTFG